MKRKPMTDDDLNALIARVALWERRQTVRNLLAGNDTQCFSTQQYLDAYGQVNRSMYKGFSLKMARKHLEMLGDEVREVRPDVWTVGERKE